MKLRNRWERRDRKRQKRKHGMRVRGRSIFTLAQLALLPKKKKK